MPQLHGLLAYLLLSWGVITVILMVLVIYRIILSNREDDQLFLGPTEDQMMASEQRGIIERADRIRRSIFTLAVLSAILLLTSAGIWLWGGLQSF